MITLSIVSPTHNCGKMLHRHLESVQKQTFRNIEHIVVDNLSTDETEKLVLAYQKHADYPVVYIREKDFGIYQAMNKGIRKASGKWVHILNSDNTYYSENVLQAVFNKNLNAYDLIACDVILNKIKNGQEESVYLKAQYHSKINAYGFPHQGTIIRKVFYEKYGCYSERYKIVSDSIYSSLNYPKAKYLVPGLPLAILSDGGISGTMSWLNTKEALIALFFFHKYPLSYKLRSAAIYLRSYFISLFTQRH